LENGKDKNDKMSGGMWKAREIRVEKAERRREMRAKKNRKERKRKN